MKNNYSFTKIFMTRMTSHCSFTNFSVKICVFFYQLLYLLCLIHYAHKGFIQPVLEKREDYFIDFYDNYSFCTLYGIKTQVMASEEMISLWTLKPYQLNFLIPLTSKLLVHMYYIGNFLWIKYSKQILQNRKYKLLSKEFERIFLQGSCRNGQLLC